MQPLMDISAIWKGIFAAARRIAGDTEARYVVLVRPNRTILCIPCPPAGSVPPEQFQPMEKVIASTAKREVAVIAPTEFACGEGGDKGSSELVAAGKAIPFFGMLSGFAYIGHSVWVFDGQAVALAAACTGADVLLIDSFYANKLTTKTVADAAAVMRNANILIHDRSAFGLRVLRKVGQSNGLEFQ